jgi:hypothetical protein
MFVIHRSVAGGVVPCRLSEAHKAAASHRLLCCHAGAPLKLALLSSWPQAAAVGGDGGNSSAAGFAARTVASWHAALPEGSTVHVFALVEVGVLFALVEVGMLFALVEVGVLFALVEVGVLFALVEVGMLLRLVHMLRKSCCG